MPYDPYQFSVARANVIGGMTSGIEKAVVDTASKIAEISKQKGINEKINGLYKETVNRFVTEMKEADPSISDEKARITAMRKLPSPMEGISSEDNLKNLLAASLSADKYIEELQKTKKSELKTRQAATAAQSAVTGGREYGMPKQIEAPGGEFEEQNITETAPPARYQEEAMSTYGQMAAEEKVPVQTTSELKEQPAIAALPKRPEPEKPMTEYQKEMLNLKRASNEIARMKAAKGDTDNIDKNLRWAQDRQDDIESYKMKYSEKLAKLRQAKVKINAGKKLNEEMLQFLTDEGINVAQITRPNADMAELTKAIDNYYNLMSNVDKLEAEADETVKGLVETGNLSKAISKGRKKKEEITTRQTEEKGALLSNAMQWIKTQSPSLFYSTDPEMGIQKIINELPVNLSSVVKESIDTARNRGVSDEAIYNRLLGKR